MSTSGDESKTLERLPVLETLPEEEEEKEEPSFIRKLDIAFDPDCVTCKLISSSVCYGSGVLVFSTVKQIPASNLPARIMCGLFGVGLFALGTLRLMVPGNDLNAPLFSKVENQNENQDRKS